MAAKQFSLFDETAQPRTSKIYVWFCPLTDSAVYVGKTSMLMARRWSNHKNQALRKPKTPKEHWLKNILELGMMPRIEVLEEVSVEESSERETYWALKYGADTDLLNCDRVGAGNPGVGRVDWTPEIIALLGKIADSKIAKMVGCERKTVAYRREILGIPPSFDLSDMKPPPPMGGHNKIDFPPHIIELLGTMPDYKVAEIAGCTKAPIMRLRNTLGIDCYAKAAGKPYCKPKRKPDLSADAQVP